MDLEQKRADTKNLAAALACKLAIEKKSNLFLGNHLPHLRWPPVRPVLVLARQRVELEQPLARRRVGRLRSVRGFRKLEFGSCVTAHLHFDTLNLVLPIYKPCLSKLRKQ